MPTPDSPGAPIRVAIIGSGPAGFYAAEHLQKKLSTAEIDMFDRLPTPFGLVRGGVAPDHQKIKSVTKVYDRIAAHPGFRFYGNVTIGGELSVEDLRRFYHAVIYCVGAQTDRSLGIPGEHLAGSHAATEFVGWFNGHPDYRDLEFDLSQTAAAVIGVGNVAVDVVRILARTPEELAATDIAPHALEALRHSRVRDIYMLGRRGPVQAAFTTPELRELGEMPAADILVSAPELQLDEFSAKALSEDKDRTAEKNLQTLTQFATRAPEGKPRRIHVRFLVSPVEILGNGRVEALKLVTNRLVAGKAGEVRAEATGQTETIPVGLVFRSVGYLGVALPGLPFDAKRGVIPNSGGRILVGEGQAVPGQYVAGWIKRGPSGVIGTNKADAVETVEAFLADHASGLVPQPPSTTRRSVEALLAERGMRFVSYDDWRRLDALELANGKAVSRPRLKFTRIAEMLDALKSTERTEAAGKAAP